jgi:hypothetical protein
MVAVAFLKNEKSSGGISEESISRSLSRSSLAKSLLRDVLLTSVRLSHGDDARHLVRARGVSHHHDPLITHIRL